MNRSLKFRVWDKKNNCFCHIPRLTFKSSNKSRYTDGLTRLVGELYTDIFSQTYYAVGTDDKRRLDTIEDFHDASKFYEIQQYTGLKDKNGKEIYEGDIIQYNRRSSYDGINFVVQWSEDTLGFIFKAKTGEVLVNERTPEGNRFSHIEVVGNIFENRNLLNHE